ncbi:MAG: hypothetical protein CVT62_10840 [Actinobacteria bacterium HGW-Actinobacteria-2]|nr:MAG: hypothetical protein CVT62_10840 [Actinobacteria bacterium HGW-Actinobacteria-2]
MNRTQRIGLAIGGGVIAIGAAVGVGAMAANLANGQGTPGGYGQGPVDQNQDGNRGPGGFDTTSMATQLAAKLGVDEAKMKTALDHALAAARPDGGSGGAPSGGAPSGMPSGAPSGMPSADGQRENRRTEMMTAMATSIATELNLDQAKVLAALQEVWPTTGGGFGGPGGQPTAAPTK